MGCGMTCAWPQRWHSYHSRCRTPSAHAAVHQPFVLAAHHAGPVHVRHLHPHAAAAATAAATAALHADVGPALGAPPTPPGSLLADDLYAPHAERQ